MKYDIWGEVKPRVIVSTLAVEWIEIASFSCTEYGLCRVSTLAVEWIEIATSPPSHLSLLVSTLAVEWIEISSFPCGSALLPGLHPRGGVD